MKWIFLIIVRRMWVETEFELEHLIIKKLS